MDSNPIQQMMMPLKNTASLLVHANISIDSGVEILRNGIKKKNKNNNMYTLMEARKVERFYFLVTILQNIRLKDSKDEHDDEEEDVRSQDGHLVNALLSFVSNTNSLCSKELDKRETVKLRNEDGHHLKPDAILQCFKPISEVGFVPFSTTGY